MSKALHRPMGSRVWIAAPTLALALSIAWGARGESTPEPIPEATPSGWPEPMESSMRFYFAQVDQLEWRGNDGDDLFRWDFQGWWGTDENKLWFKSEGETRTSGPSGGDAEIQLLYSRMIAEFWDAQIGVRQDLEYGAGRDHERTFAAIGFEGLAPYWFELEPTLFVSDDGDVSARLTALYELQITQRVVAEPRFEVNVAAQNARKFGVRSGFNDVELGLRVRYQLGRKAAPYIGVSWLRKLGKTANLARSLGDEVDTLGGVVGIRFQY